MSGKDWIEIARTGRFTDMGGREVEIGPTHLERLAATDLTAGGVPLVFGHPRVEDPAYGWVDELQVQGDRLLAKLRDVPEAVRGLVRDGHYRHVSIRATPDLGRLRHVGLLGAVPPAIEGLKPVELAAPDGSVDLVFAQQHMEGQMDELTKALNELAATKTALAEREGQLKAVEGELQNLQRDFAAHRDETVRKNREARVQRLVESGRIMPGAKDETLAFATALAQGDTTLNFASEGPLPAEEAFFRRLEARDDNGLFVEFATPGSAGAGEEPTAARDAAPAALAGKF